MKIQLSDHFTYGKLIKFTLPSIMMMIFTSVYSVIDGIFVSNFAGKTPFTAINLIMPYIMAVGAFGFMVGTGGTALISKTLGMGEHRKANEIFSMLVWLCLIGGAILTALSQIFLRSAAMLFGAEGEVLENCILYGRIILFAAPAYILQFAFQNFCVAAEKGNLSLTMTLIAGICNILLDAVFVAIFHWGLTGAAVATVIAQTVGAVVPLIYFARPNESLLQMCKFSIDIKALLRTFTNGSSELLSNLSMNIVVMLYNIQLMRFAGEDGVAAYGVIMYVNLFFLAIFLGFAIGSAPLIGYNFGAQDHKEMKNIFRKSMVIIAVSSLLMTIVAIALSRILAQIFVGYDVTLTEMTVRGFVIYSFSFLLSGFNIFGSSMFTALNNGVVSAVISCFRTLICQLVAVTVLPLLFQLDGVWMAIVAAEIAALLLNGFFIIRFRKKYHYA